jgi:uncharacterized membrane protein YoaK (UPF0700 family)
MPIDYLRTLSGKERTRDANRHLGFILAFVAGGINAGGFLAVQRYTSHMTGLVSEMADGLVLGAQDMALASLGALVCFLLGAMCSTMLVHYSRRHHMHSEYALPLLLEAALLLCFGVVGGQLHQVDGLFVSATVMLLSFMMGLQNAVITSLSQAEIRTTHVTGIVTDIGIELGRLIYWNASKALNQPAVMANRERLQVLTLLVLSFFVGGVLGALGFKHLGYSATIPLAILLVALASIPVVDDLQGMVRQRQTGR